MAPYTVFQRFCVLLLSIHGQVEKYSARSGEENKESDTTQFLKNLNVYQSMLKIDETIREKHYTEDQLTMLLRD